MAQETQGCSLQRITGQCFVHGSVSHVTAMPSQRVPDKPLEYGIAMVWGVIPSAEHTAKHLLHSSKK